VVQPRSHRNIWVNGRGGPTLSDPSCCTRPRTCPATSTARGGRRSPTPACAGPAGRTTQWTRVVAPLNPFTPQNPHMRVPHPPPLRPRAPVSRVFLRLFCQTSLRLLLPDPPNPRLQRALVLGVPLAARFPFSHRLCAILEAPAPGPGPRGNAPFRQGNGAVALFTGFRSSHPVLSEGMVWVNSTVAGL